MPRVLRRPQRRHRSTLWARIHVIVMGVLCILNWCCSDASVQRGDKTGLNNGGFPVRGNTDPEVRSDQLLNKKAQLTRRNVASLQFLEEYEYSSTLTRSRSTRFLSSQWHIASAVPSYTGHPRSGYHFEVPFPRREQYPLESYTLSGGIFESVVEDTCQRMAQRSKTGWCPPPCQMEPESKRGLSASKRDTQSCLIMPYAPGVRADKTGHSLDSFKHNLNVDSKTRDIKLGSCPCVDPCAMYTSCSECTANKDASVLEESPSMQFSGTPSPL